MEACGSTEYSASLKCCCYRDRPPAHHTRTIYLHWMQWHNEQTNCRIMQNREKCRKWWWNHENRVSASWWFYVINLLVRVFVLRAVSFICLRSSDVILICRIRPFYTSFDAFFLCCLKCMRSGNKQKRDAKMYKLLVEFHIYHDYLIPTKPMFDHSGYIEW